MFQLRTHVTACSANTTSVHDSAKEKRLRFPCAISTNPVSQIKFYLHAIDHCAPPQLLPLLPSRQIRADMVSPQVGLGVFKYWIRSGSVFWINL